MCSGVTDGRPDKTSQDKTRQATVILFTEELHYLSTSCVIIKRPTEIAMILGCLVSVALYLKVYHHHHDQKPGRQLLQAGSEVILSLILSLSTLARSFSPRCKVVAASVF